MLAPRVVLVLALVLVLVFVLVLIFNMHMLVLLPVLVLVAGASSSNTSGCKENSLLCRVGPNTVNLHAVQRYLVLSRVQQAPRSTYDVASCLKYCRRVRFQELSTRPSGGSERSSNPCVCVCLCVS